MIALVITDIGLVDSLITNAKIPVSFVEKISENAKIGNAHPMLVSKDTVVETVASLKSRANLFTIDLMVNEVKSSLVIFDFLMSIPAPHHAETVAAKTSAVFLAPSK
jgi:hypothetical protein